MKICFVCGFLEPGKSGVGDYAVLLAKKLAELGHECSLLALNDPFVQSSLEWNIPSHQIRILRLPKTSPWSDRVKQAREFVVDCGAEVLSLQYVSYAYAKRGLTFQLGEKLRQISQGIPWHVMVHEIWLGERKGACLKDRLIGTAQLLLVKDLFLQISPRLVHTSNSTYQGCLLRRGVESRILPMFCTIPVNPEADTMRFLDRLRERGLPLSRRERCDHLLFGMFGVLFPAWPAEPLFSELHQFGERQGKRVAIISMGSMGAGNALWGKLRELYGRRFIFLELGRLEESDISNYLIHMDYGIAATPLQLLGKSTSAAAFLEHGVPLVVNRMEPYGLPSDTDILDELVIPLDENIQDNLLRKKKRNPEPKVNDVARQFVKDLQVV